MKFRFEQEMLNEDVDKIDFAQAVILSKCLTLFLIFLITVFGVFENTSEIKKIDALLFN